MGNVKISAFGNQPDLDKIIGFAGYEGTVGSYTNAQISGTEMQTWLQNNLTFATASGTQNTLAMFTSANAVGDSIINQAVTGSATIIQIGSSSSAAKLNVNTSTRNIGVAGGVNWTSGSGFTDYYGVSGSAGSNAGSTNWTNTGVLGNANRSDTRNTGVRGVGGNPGSTTNAGTNYGGHFSAKNGDNNYSLRLEDGTESAGKFLKCITADGEAQWATVNAGVVSLTSANAAITLSGSGTITITSVAYGGTTDIGHVPTGGTDQKFLTGDGTWTAPDLDCLQFPPGGSNVNPMISTMVGGVAQGSVRISGTSPIAVTRNDDNGLTISTTATGTLSSVGLTMPSGFSVGSSPLTSNGTLAVTINGGSATTFYRGDGSWVTPTDTQYSVATSTTLGLIKIGYSQTGKNYPVVLDADKAYVNVPWTDNNDNTTYDISITRETVGSDDSPYLTLTPSTGTADNIQLAAELPSIVTRSTDDIVIFSSRPFAGSSTTGHVPSSASAGQTTTFLRADGTWVAPSGSGSVTTVGVTNNISAFDIVVTNATTTPDIEFSVVGATSGQFLNHLGEWSVPSDTTYTAGGGITISTADQISITNTTVTAGTYGDASKVPQITVNDKGQLTNVSEVTISAGGGSLTPVTKTASYTAAADDFIICNVNGTLEITLPSSASAGDIVGVKYASQNAQTDILRVKTSSSSVLIDSVDRNTNPLPIPAVNTYFEFIYADSTNWYIK